MRQAIAAAPAPLQAMVASSILRPVISSALRMPAAVTMAVPCWSSWKTGIFIRALSCFSISKQAGAAMSSRLMPPKVGSRRAMASTKGSTAVSSTSMSITSMPENFLKSAGLALHHRLRGQRADVAEAEDGGAVRDHRDEVGAAGVERRRRGVLLDRRAGVGDAGAVGEGEVALGRHRLGRQDLELTRGLGRMVGERLALEFVGHGVSPPASCSGPPVAGGPPRRVRVVARAAGDCPETGAVARPGQWPIAARPRPAPDPPRGVSPGRGRRPRGRGARRPRRREGRRRGRRSRRRRG